MLPVWPWGSGGVNESRGDSWTRAPESRWDGRNGGQAGGPTPRDKEREQALGGARDTLRGRQEVNLH